MSRDEEENELDEGVEDDDFDGDSLENELDAELIEEWCPRCGDVKPHAVIKGNKIACAACNFEHIREGEEKGTPVQMSLLSAEEKVPGEKQAEAWKRLTDVEDEEMLPYSIKLKLADGKVIRHNKFGIGVVVEMIDTTKAEVLFSDGIRRLVCGK